MYRFFVIAHDGHHLVLIEGGITGGAVADASAGIFLFPFDFAGGRLGAYGNKDAFGA